MNLSSKRGPLTAIFCLLSSFFVVTGCNGNVHNASDVGAAPEDLGQDLLDTPTEDVFDVTDSAPEETEPPLEFVAVTFNTGTSEGMVGDDDSNGGYTSAHAALSDEWYGDGLAWMPAVEATTAFFADLDPDVVTFQEIFWTGECPDMPEDAREDFICETWVPGDPTVAQVVLGEDWQVVCHPGKPDKCAAVNRRLGTFAGCDEEFCLEGLEGYRVEDCGRGARVGRGVIDLVGGGTLTLVSVHGSSGMSDEDVRCRSEQIEQIFVDLGDGMPGANGARNLIMGDINTDPGRLADFDASAALWNDYVGDDKTFHFVTEVGSNTPATYGGAVSIDHVVSDVFFGSCWTAGLTDEHPAVIDAIYFDHKPVVCAVEME